MKKVFVILAVCIVLFTTACKSNSGNSSNNAPYNIIGPTGNQNMTSLGTLNIFLDVDDQGGKNDPDGDVVTFFHEYVEFLPPLGQDPGLIIKSLNSSTGEFSITDAAPFTTTNYWVKFRFWTQDPAGLSSVPFEVIFAYW